MLLPEITDGDIDQIEKEFGLIFDEERRAILKCRESKDVRACPGSGKTTLVVAKLALLANKWEWGHRGICIISHTNVAHNEIQKHFKKSPELQVYLNYPHFIGTIQSFMNQFLALPAAITRFGTRPVIYDNELYEAEAEREFSENSKKNGAPYWSARWTIKNIVWDKSFNGVLEYVGRVEYQDKTFAIPELAAKKKKISWQTESGQQLLGFKEAMSRKGFFRYQDMFALAAWYLDNFPQIVTAVSERFPFVIIDEMQDTIAEQGQLIHDTFGERSVIQRFGDDRQAIYHSTNSSTVGAKFPSGNVLPMKKSHRLSCSIANLVKNVCETPDELLGDESKPTREHTVFAFSRNKIKEVIPAFAELVAKEIGCDNPASQIKVVGATSKLDKEEEKIPRGIGDYLRRDFVRGKPKKAVDLKSLQDYFCYAKAVIDHKSSVAEARAMILGAIVKILRLQGLKNGDRNFTASTFLRHLQENSPHKYKTVSQFIGRTCLYLVNSAEPNYGKIAEEILGGLDMFGKQEWCKDVTDFVKKERILGDVSVDDSEEDFFPDNILTHKTKYGTVSVEVGTIHSVKGETLKAILVLETFLYVHDLKELVEKGFFCGAQKTGSVKKRLSDNLKRIYVGMSRPTDLLCLAILDDHLKDGKEDMEKMGWSFDEIAEEVQTGS